MTELDGRTPEIDDLGALPEWATKDTAREAAARQARAAARIQKLIETGTPGEVEGAIVAHLAIVQKVEALT